MSESHSRSRDFAVVRGRCWTLFGSAEAAYIFWSRHLGSVLLFRTAKGEKRWLPAF